MNNNSRNNKGQNHASDNYYDLKISFDCSKNSEYQIDKKSDSYEYRESDKYTKEGLSDQLFKSTTIYHEQKGSFCHYE